MTILTFPFQSMSLLFRSLTTLMRVPSVRLSTSLKCEHLCFVPDVERDVSDVSPLGHTSIRYLGVACLCSPCAPVLLCLGGTGVGCSFPPLCPVLLLWKLRSDTLYSQPLLQLKGFP